jgi:large repetitive protein
MELLRYLSSGLAALSVALVAVVLSASPALAAGSVLTPSAQTVQVGETIGLSVTGFKPCPALESPAVLWDQNPLSYKLVAGSLTANDFTVDFVVPSSPVGSHLIAAGCLTVNGYALQQRVPLKVVAAALALAPSPQSVQAGGTVTMTGSGFVLCTDPAGSTTVELSATGTLLAAARGSNGAFQQAITVPSGTPAGPYPVTAQCSAQPGSDLTSTSVYVVTLALSPSSGIPGTTISVADAGYTQCHEVQLQLLRDTTQAVATSSPFVPANGSFTAELTVPSSAALGTDYQVDAGCYPAAGTSAAIAVEPFAVTSPASSTSPTPSSTPTSSTSPTPSSTPTSSTSPSPAHSGTTTSPSSPGSPSPQSSRHTGGRWAPVALVGGTGAGLALAALLLVRALSMVHGKRGRGWVNKHLRVVAGSAGPLSADVEHRPGAVSVSVGLEPHLDHLGHQQYEEVTAQ